MSVGGPSGGPVPTPALLDTVEQSLSGSLCVIVRISSTTMSTNPEPYPVSEKAGQQNRTTVGGRETNGHLWRPDPSGSKSFSQPPSPKQAVRSFTEKRLCDS